MRTAGGLELDDVLRRRPLRALHDFKLHALSFGQRLEALRLDRGVMHEVGSNPTPSAIKQFQPVSAGLRIAIFSPFVPVTYGVESSLGASPVIRRAREKMAGNW